MVYPNFRFFVTLVIFISFIFILIKVPMVVYNIVCPQLYIPLNLVFIQWGIGLAFIAGVLGVLAIIISAVIVLWMWASGVVGMFF